MRAILLGSSALCRADRDYTSLLIQLCDGLVLIDCNGSPVKKLLQLGMDPLILTAILITHHHTDHIYGLPILIHEIMLRDRSRDIDIFLPEPAMVTLSSLVNAHFAGEPKLSHINFSPINLKANTSVIETNEWSVSCTPVEHGVPTLAYKIVEGGKILVYAPDTKPCQRLIEFAHDADLLFHDCAFPDGKEEEAERGGHSTPSQVGRLAHLAGVEKLVLVHLGLDCIERELVNSVRREFSREVIVGSDLLAVEL